MKWYYQLFIALGIAALAVLTVSQLPSHEYIYPEPTYEVEPDIVKTITGKIGDREVNLIKRQDAGTVTYLGTIGQYEIDITLTEVE